MALRRLVAALFLSALLPASSAWANVAPVPAREDVQKKLETFFAHLDDKSPAGFSDVAKSPKVREEINKKIESMSDADVAEFQKMMNEVPDWQTAPQSITKMLSPEAMKTIQKASEKLTKDAPKAEKTRSDIATLSTVLKMLPDEKLKDLGVTREMLNSLDGAINQISPLQAGILEQQAMKSPGFDEKSAAAMAALPPALQKGAAALAKHGPLTALDKVELEKFRSQLTTLFGRVQALPDATKKDLKIEDLRAEVAQLDHATPDVLFMVREQMPPDMLQKLSDSVDLMQKIANLTDDQRKNLEQFRSGLEDVFARGEHAADNRQKIASLSTSELVVMQQGMPDLDTWKQDKAGFLNALSDPGLGQRITALQQKTPDPAAVASLEQYRVQTLSMIESAKTAIDPKLATSAHDVVAKAPLASLEMLRTVQNSTPNMTPEALVRAANDIGSISLNCKLSLGSIDLGALGSFSLGSIDFNFICKPIQDAINAIDGAINTAVNAVSDTVTNVINGVKTFLNDAISAAQNFLRDLINTVTSTVNTIWNFVQTIPSLAWGAIKAAFNAILDLPLPGTNGLTLRLIISGGLKQIVPALQNALNMTGEFWNSLNDSLPLIPCPPAGFSTPFGTVGNADTVTKYNRYAFFLDKIFGLIPSDVFSLEVKIPAQVLYAAWQYLGLCLQDAANAAASAQADQQYSTIITNFTNLGNQANGNMLSLIATINGDFNSLTALNNTNTSNLTTLITNKMIDLTNLIKSKSDDARALALRMAIEVDLQNGPPNGLVMFQLPQANGGYLELVRDTVNNDINAVLASGQSVGNAQRFFSDALTAMANGKFKDAFKSFQKAYTELTKQ